MYNKILNLQQVVRRGDLTGNHNKQYKGKKWFQTSPGERLLTSYELNLGYCHDQLNLSLEYSSCNQVRLTRDCRQGSPIDYRLET